MIIKTDRERRPKCSSVEKFVLLDENTKGKIIWNKYETKVSSSLKQRVCQEAVGDQLPVGFSLSQNIHLGTVSLCLAMEKNLEKCLWFRFAMSTVKVHEMACLIFAAKTIEQLKMNFEEFLRVSECTSGKRKGSSLCIIFPLHNRYMVPQFSHRNSRPL